MIQVCGRRCVRRIVTDDGQKTRRIGRLGISGRQRSLVWDNLSPDLQSCANLDSLLLYFHISRLEFYDSASRRSNICTAEHY